MAATPDLEDPGERYASKPKGRALAEYHAAQKDLADKLKKLKGRAKKRRDPWLPHWQDVYDYVFPYREGFFNQAEGQRKTDWIFDQTAVVGVPQFASRIQTGMFPAQGRAFGLAPGVDVPKDKQTRDMQAQLDLIAQAFHEGLRNSNFESELHEGAQDLGIGTMNMMVEPGVYPGDIRCTSVPPNQLYILPGGNDTVGMWWYERPNMTFQEVRETWPRARFSEAMEAAERSNPDATITVAQVTVADQAEIFEPHYDYFLFCETHSCTLEHRHYSGIGSCPWITARWSKTSNEVWGRGPILTVLPSIKTTNLTVQMVLENAEMAITGMYSYDDDGVFNPDNIVVQPGMFVPRAPGSRIDAIQSPSRFDISTLVLNDERQNIKKGLFIDELDRDAKTPYSAEEVGQRMAAMARNMGSVSGRLWSEFMQPLAKRLAFIYRTQGLIDLPKIDGKMIRMVPLSPLLRTQDLADISNFVQYVQVMNGTMGATTSSLSLNKNRTIDWLNDKFGVDKGILNTPNEARQMIENATSMVAAAQGQKQGQGAAPSGEPPLMTSAVNGGLSLQG
jgi:hypothetical protein